VTLQPTRRLPSGEEQEESVLGNGQPRAVWRSALVVVAALFAGGCLGDDQVGDHDARRASGHAAFAPRLRVEQHPSLPGRPTSLTIDVTQQPGERALQSAEIVVPAGFRIAPPPSGPMGELDAAFASGTETALTGRLERTKGDGADGTCVEGRAMKLAALLGPAPPLRLSLFVRDAAGSTRLTICPPTRDERPIRRLTIRLEQGLTPPNVGDAVWRGLFTPAEGPATESRAIVPAPSFLTLETPAGERVVAGSSLHVRGYLLQRRAQPRRKVRILAGPARGRLEVVGRARTGSNGSYTFTMRAPERPGTLYVAARALSVERGCRGASSAPAGCTTTTVSGVSSQPLRLSVVSR
jgi:hypothetical protein